MGRRIICISIAILMIFSVKSQVTQAENRHVSAQAAILMEQESGRVLYEKNAHDQLRIASITKIMTALLAIESGKMNEMVKVSNRAEGTEGSSIYLRAGEEMALEDLVYGLMLRSGNDAAVAIAEHVGGSLEGFVYLMNEKAKQIGMYNTLFQNPHGLDDHEDHFSTAYDMALLTQYAMQVEQYRTISSTKSHRVDGEQIRVWKNKNRLLTELYSYSTGGKTGFTKRAKRTLVSTAEKNENKYIVVTLNAPSDWHDHMNLFEWAFDQYETETIIDKGMIKGIDHPFYKDRIYVPHPFLYPLNDSEKKSLELSLTLDDPPQKSGQEQRFDQQKVGHYDVLVYNEVIGRVPVIYEAPVEQEKSFWTNFKNVFSFYIGVKPYD
ncbi:D-alanyl-D-alanine carboxypeptidase family protein [Halalkalibacter hemicellulosilyticus]|uniref:D-alanyl-D-alanine carboxypeptidase n=1 Tax=Halalkalibacter hemicellulosilyticusJCM 9152 TaxID=1236971 RepID=W4QA91_9BACI|nr:D-alanyl-D-alanine carboxypeptidase family protein [Halalkalibacter hemicellulosilyticus]GAE28956.1 D-alanyl-D-alanine carboxypeptidase [Halalkalibacter hemicellulosilyticusJCM 9152]